MTNYQMFSEIFFHLTVIHIATETGKEKNDFNIESSQVRSSQGALMLNKSIKLFMKALLSLNCDQPNVSVPNH